MSVKSLATRVVYRILGRKPKLVILDNYFPNANCGFKINEYTHLLKVFPNSEIYSTWPDFSRASDVYFQKYPEYQKRVKPFTSKKFFFATTFYTSFLHTTYSFLPLFEREQTPFVFSLYGGGFFGFNYPESDRKLEKICKSPFLKKIIVSQKKIADYIVEKEFCSAEKIEFIYGSPPSTNQTEKKFLENRKKKYPTDKKTFDICFVGRRHTPKGRDKGYHLFVAAAKLLERQFDSVRFHVVGNFTKDTIALENISKKTTFWGEIPLESLPAFFSTQDIYLSPNIPNQIHPGSFEGITGTCQEAALAGTAVFCTDVLKMNLYFQHKKNIIFLEPTVNNIVEQCLYYFHHLDDLYRISTQGRKKFSEVFDFTTYMTKKCAILSESIG